MEHEGKKTRTASIISCDAAADRSQSHVFGSITLKGTLALVQYNSSQGSTQPGILDHVSGAKGYCCAFDTIAFGKAPLLPAPSGSNGPNVICPHPRFDAGGGTVRLLLEPINENEDFQTTSAFRRIGIDFWLRRGYDPVRKWDAEQVELSSTGSSSDDDDPNVLTNIWGTKTIEVQRNRVVTIF